MSDQEQLDPSREEASIILPTEIKEFGLVGPHEANTLSATSTEATSAFVFNQNPPTIGSFYPATSEKETLSHSFQSPNYAEISWFPPVDYDETMATQLETWDKEIATYEEPG